MTASVDNPRPLRISDEADALALVHSSFGHIPKQSLVLIGLAGSSSGAHLRVDLDPIIRAEEDAVHQLADYLCHDEQHAPEALLVIILDQQLRHAAEAHSALLVQLQATFALRDIAVVAEHRITGDHDPEKLHQVLQQHPQLSSTTAAPEEEAAQWLSTATTPDLSTAEHEELTARRTSQAADLLIAAESPDWAAIERLDALLHVGLPPAGMRARDTVIALKAMIEHAKGRSSAASAFLAHTDDKENHIVAYATRATCTVHRFALRKDTSHAHWKR